MAMIRINTLPTPTLGAAEATGASSAALMDLIPPDVMLHHAMNPVSPETSIVYTAAAERYFMTAGDLANVAFSRRLLVQNRIAIAFDLLFEHSLFDFLDELQNAWLERFRPESARCAHQAEDYETAANAFDLALKDAEGLSDAEPRLMELLEIAGEFRGATWGLEPLRAWTDRARAALPETSLSLLDARLLWQSKAFHESLQALRETAAALETKRACDRLPDYESLKTWRREGFLRYTTALALLLKPDAEIDHFNGAVEELKEAVACLQRSNEPFPFILYKRLAETHETLGQAHFDKKNMHSAGYHFEQARIVESYADPRRLPVARALAKRTSKGGWRAALRSLLGRG